jgi:hypothetical protein
MTSISRIVLVAFPLIAGCSERQSYSEPYPAATAVMAKRMINVPVAPAPNQSKPAATVAGASALPVVMQPGAQAAAASATNLARKIIYDAQVDLVVESVEPASRKVMTLVQQAGGYVAEQTTLGSPGSVRSLQLRVRVPVDRFDSVVESITALGELERNNRTSQDVTEQYYDLEARIKNKRVEEQTLNKILQERSGKLEDVLKIEIELSRVRGEIEQFEGKIRVLENLASLATLTLGIREREKYAPPAPVVADFRTQITRTWDQSLVDLMDTGKALSLWLVRWAIYFPFIVLALLLTWIVSRWLLRKFLRNLPRLLSLLRTPIGSPRVPSSSS